MTEGKTGQTGDRSSRVTHVWLSYWRLAGFWIAGCFLLVVPISVAITTYLGTRPAPSTTHVLFLTAGTILGLSPTLLPWKYGRRKGPILTLSAKGLQMNAIDPERVIPWKDIDIVATWRLRGGWQAIITFRAASWTPRSGRQLNHGDQFEIRLPNIITGGCRGVERLAKLYREASVDESD